MSSPLAGKRLTTDEVNLLLAVLERTPRQALFAMPIWDGEDGIVKQLDLKDAPTAQAKYEALLEKLNKARPYRPRPSRSSHSKESDGQSLTEISKAKKMKNREPAPDFKEFEGQIDLMEGISGLLESNVEVDDIDGLFTEMETNKRSRPTE